jgi:hypothetical protein
MKESNAMLTGELEKWKTERLMVRQQIVIVK